MAEAKKEEKKEEVVQKKASKIRPCSCSSAFQDKTYGKGLRIFRITKKGEERCTVCNPDRRTSRTRLYVKNEATPQKYPFLFK